MGKTELLQAIHRKCVHCTSGDVDGSCAGACRLAPFRWGVKHRTTETERELLDIIYQHCIDCAGSLEEAENCTSNKTNTLYTACQLHEFRPWGVRLDDKGGIVHKLHVKPRPQKTPDIGKQPITKKNLKSR